MWDKKHILREVAVWDKKHNPGEVAVWDKKQNKEQNRFLCNRCD